MGKHVRGGTNVEKKFGESRWTETQNQRNRQDSGEFTGDARTGS